MLLITALSFLVMNTLSALTVTISGTVTTTSGGNPIPNHGVSIQDSASASFIYFNTVMTDANGHYSVTITNVPAGTYFIVSTLDCNSYYQADLVNGNNSPITVNFQICGGTPPNHTVTVSGTVTNTSDGSPVPNQKVEIQDTMSGSYYYYNSMYTDNSGNYTFTIQNVPPNAWFWVWTSDCNNVLHSDIVNSDEGYCGGNNFQICTSSPPPTLTVSISGTVTDIANGNPIPNHSVYIQADSSSGGFTYYTQVTTNSSGFYSVSIPNVPQNTTFNVYTYDCNYTIHQQDVNGDNSPITVNFQICSGNPSYYLLYGQVFAGSALLDKGKVDLIRIDSLNNATIIATWYIQDTAPGNYEFFNVLAGNYYLKATPSDSSVFFNQYAPTYYDTTLYWTNAILINFQNQTYCNIHLVPLTPQSPGNGSISGSIQQNVKTSMPLAGAEVLLLNQSSQPLAYTWTDANGDYSFQNLAFATYIIYPEITKVTTIPSTVTLDADHPAAIANFILEDGMIITGIKENPGMDLSSVSNIFPDPVIEKANVTVNSVMELPVQLTLFNSAGRIVSGMPYLLQKGLNTITLTITGFPDGCYQLLIKSNEGSAVRKLIIRN